MGLLSRFLPRSKPTAKTDAVIDPMAADGRSVVLFGHPTPETFVEADYLDFNPDIRHAVDAGAFKSGRDHFDKFHHLRTHKVPFPQSAEGLRLLRAKKATHIADIMCEGVLRGDDDVFDALTPEMRKTFGVIDTKNVSSNDYDGGAIAIIDQFADGLILDCGAGSRPIYYDNVVNYEIVKYPSTDVVGVAEVLPFKDASFDAVFSYAVLEHVKQPFLAAKEISRVLKPGGMLRVVVPFLQPLHGFPSHYFNMTQFGLASLFEEDIEIDQQFVGPQLGPIWTMYTLIRAWHGGLPAAIQESFLDLRLRDLFVHPTHMFEKDFVARLSESATFEIASATGLIGHKRARPSSDA